MPLRNLRNITSWERVSKIIKETKDTEVLHHIISGIVGSVACAEFFQVVEEIDSLPPIPDILAAEGSLLLSLLPNKVSAMYGLAYSVSSYCNNLNDYRNAIRVFNTLVSIDDGKPRYEIQALAMEILLFKVHSLKDANLILKLTRSPEYTLYRKQVKSVLSPSL